MVGKIGLPDDKKIIELVDVGADDSLLFSMPYSI
jgi:hypothetical protein